jgi:hypothetical protein
VALDLHAADHAPAMEQSVMEIPMALEKTLLILKITRRQKFMGKVAIPQAVDLPSGFCGRAFLR